MIHSGGLKLNLEKKLLQPILKLAVMENKLVTDSKSQQVAMDVGLAARSTHILCDQTAMIQILSNLINNASKYSPVSSRIEVSAKVVGEEVVIAVKDQGPGIAEEIRENLFHPFLTGPDRPTGGEHSIGYGLSVVKSLTEAMGGTVGVHSQRGRGSEFWVSFPIFNDTVPESKEVTVKTEPEVVV